MILTYLRATLAVALCIFCLDVEGQISTSSSETFRDIFEKSQNLVLQKNRQQAFLLLQQTFRKENRQQVILEFVKRANEIGEIFINEQTQQLYESSVALQKDDLNQGLEKIIQAYKLEPDNVTILNSYIRLLIAKGDCSSALELAQKHSDYFWFNEELKLARAQAFVCQSNWIEYSKIAEPQMIKKSSLRKFWILSDIAKQYHFKNNSKALEQALILKRLDEKNPEMVYWIWKIHTAQGKLNPSEGKAYLAACKNISTQLYRQYLLDPLICRHGVEVTTELKGQNEILE